MLAACVVSGRRARSKARARSSSRMQRQQQQSQDDAAPRRGMPASLVESIVINGRSTISAAEAAGGSSSSGAASLLLLPPPSPPPAAPASSSSLLLHLPLHNPPLLCRQAAVRCRCPARCLGLPPGTGVSITTAAIRLHAPPPDSSRRATIVCSCCCCVLPKRSYRYRIRYIIDTTPHPPLQPRCSSSKVHMLLQQPGCRRQQPAGRRAKS